MGTRSKIFNIVIGSAVASGIALSGCSKSQQQPQATSTASESAAKQLADQGKTKDAANYYARIGELLLLPEGFKYADDMFAKALALDPSNAKANFYKAITEPTLELQGFIPRLETMATPAQVAQLEQLRSQIAQLNMPELKDFANNLPPGGAAFTNYYDVQRFLRESILPSLLASLDKLSKIDLSQGSLQLNFTPSRLDINPNSENSVSYSDCDSGSSGWNCTVYSTQGSSNPSQNLYFVDKYDMKAIQSLLRASIDEIRVATAYSLQDGQVAMNRINALSQNGTLTDQGVAGILRSYPELLSLESDQQLSEIIASTSQALKDGLELSALSGQLCDASTRNQLTSIIYPICITSQAASTYQLSLDLLAGPKVVSIGNDIDGNPVNIEVDVTAVLKNPVRDLKTLLPVSFDASGNALEFSDHTMGGLFPNGDILSKIKQVADGGPEQNMESAINGLLPWSLIPGQSVQSLPWSDQN